MAPPPHPSLLRAKARLDLLELYPRPVRLQGVRLVAAPWLFRLPWLRRFDGYATHRVIFVRTRAHMDDGDLVTHELCHVWQMQYRPLRMPFSYLRGYSDNPYELEARRATAATARTPARAPCP
jgi:hypothetical protein